MNKEIIEEKALLYAFGTMAEDEIEEFETLIQSDRMVQELVHESQALNELEAAECELEEPPFQTYSRIMATIDAAKGTSATTSQIADSGSRESSKVVPFLAWSGWAAAACAAVLFGAGVFDKAEPVAPVVASVVPVQAAPVVPGSDIILNNLANPLLVAMQIPSEEFGVEDRMLELASLAEAYWFSREGIPSGQLLAEADTEVEEISGGFTIFDRKYQIGFIAVENLPAEVDGKSYHVWAKTKKGQPPVKAGSLPIGEDSRGLFFFDLSSVPEVASLDRINFFVTEERTENPTGPTGMVVLSNYLR